MGLTAADITKALAVKHTKDVFVPECKDGPTWFNSHLRLDAWAMKRSWSKPCVWGYEIKISRRDFVQDDKWPGYLPYCNQFYFVAPQNIIQPDELPAEVGLLVASKNGSRLYLKKKAPHRDVDIDPTIFRYVLMCRARISQQYEVDAIRTRDYWIRWLAQKEENRELGYRVSQALGRRYERDVEEVRIEQEKLRKKIGRLETIERWAEKNKINLFGWSITSELDDLRERSRSLVDRKTERILDAAHRELGRLLALIEKNSADAEGSGK